MTIPKLERLAKPTATLTYFDLIQIWLPEPLGERTESWLRRNCRDFYIKHGPAPFGNGYHQRIEMKGLSDNALAVRTRRCVDQSY